ncbi:MAG: O-antigen ligase family protein [Pyrinomonadaceae bacterium]
MEESLNEFNNIEVDPTKYGKAIVPMLYAILLLTTLAFGAVDTIAAGALSIVAAAIVVLWALDAWHKRHINFSSSLLQLPLIGLILIGVVQLLPMGAGDGVNGLLSIPASVSISSDAYATRIFVIRLIGLLVFFAAGLTFINSKKRVRNTVVGIIVFGATIAFFGILQRLADPEGIYGIRVAQQAIPFGPFVNQHHFAAFMEMTAGVTLGLLFGRSTDKDKRIFLIFAVVLMGIATVLTSSRGGMLSFLGVLTTVIVANYIRGKQLHGHSSENYRGFVRKFAIAASGAALMLLIFGMVILLGGDQSLIRGIGLSGGAGDLTSGRTHIWNVAWQVFMENPILGTGLDTFGVSYPRFDSTGGAMRVEMAHNDYLQILTDAGVVGFAMVAAFIFLLFKTSLAVIGKAKDGFRRGAATGALAGCFGILIHSFFDFPLRTYSNAYFFLILVVIATATYSEPGRRRRVQVGEHADSGDEFR